MAYKHRDYLEGCATGIMAMLTIVMIAFSTGHVHIYDRLYCIW